MTSILLTGLVLALVTAMVLHVAAPDVVVYFHPETLKEENIGG